jgi:hypothetical protein
MTVLATMIYLTAKLLILVRGVNNRFSIVTEIISVEAMKGTATNEGLYKRVSTTTELHKLS